MRLLRLLPLLLLACAAPAGSEYRQGVPMPRPPPAPPFRPGVGAPVVGQPGSATAPIPRSPNSRVLPPSNEPGLWSADRPRASRQEYVLPMVLGFTPPVVAQEEEEAAVYADNCSQLVDDTRRLPSVARALGRVSAREASCTGAKALYGCLMRPWLEASGKKDAASKATAKALGLYLQRLLQEVDKGCKGLDPQRPDLMALLRTVQTAWMNTMTR